MVQYVYREVKIARINYPKYFLKELLIRPFNIIVFPILLATYFVSWLCYSEKAWNEGELYFGVRFDCGKKIAREFLWWNLKSSCINEHVYYERY